MALIEHAASRFYSLEAQHEFDSAQLRSSVVVRNSRPGSYSFYSMLVFLVAGFVAHASQP